MSFFSLNCEKSGVMNRLFKILILFFFLLGIDAFAQGDSLRYAVRGTVRDSETGRPLSDVGVSIPGTRYATVTNQEGAFVIKSDTRPATVAFSLLGYRSMTGPVPEDLKKPMHVRLTKGSYMLEAARVYSGDPMSLLLKAIDLIPENCPSEPELFDCFYRETVQKRQRFIYISEAVTKMYKNSFRKGGWRDKAAIVKSRILTSPRSSDTLGVKVVGGPVMAVELDLVKNRQFILSPSELTQYRLELLPPEFLDERMQFVIRLTPAVERPYALHFGKIYLDQETLSFTRIELNLDISNPVKATEAMLVRKPVGIRFKPKEMSLLLHYRTEEGKTRLAYQRTVFRFNCDWRRKLFATEFTAVAEMVVTNRHQTGSAEPILRNEAFKSSESLADKAYFYDDSDFWKDYNIIEPTESLEHAISRLKK